MFKFSICNINIDDFSSDSDKSADKDRYEDDDTHYDGEREGSDSDSPSPRQVFTLPINLLYILMYSFLLTDVTIDTMTVRVLPK